jgi:tetratricopeptide (TPR) repeat protein
MIRGIGKRMNKQEISDHVRAELDNAHHLLAAGRRQDALGILRPMLKSQAAGPVWGRISLLLMRAGDLDSALVAARKFVAAAPDNVEAMSLLANVLSGIGRLDEAIALAKRVCKQLPNNPATHYNLGIYLSRDGQTARALKSFSEAVALDPNHALSLEYLAYLGPGETESPVLEQIEGCLARNDPSDPASRAALQYGKAVILERQQDWDQAFAAYESGAELMKNVARTDLSTVKHYISSLKNSFSADFFEMNAESRYKNERPVFIVGMPRSGTTLVESVFASHSKVKAGGETRLLGLATMQYGRFEPRDLERIRDAINAGRNPWAETGREYRRLQKQRYGNKGTITEKNLGHHFLLGVIAMIASGARIIYCTREPVATAWSCYKIRFSNGNGWSYDFESIGRYQRLYRDLMSHWQQVLPDAPILQLPYEDLVSNPGEVIPGILTHAGLAVEPACLTPHHAKMPVMTASVAQVRQPIQTDANLAWRNYKTQLAPYLEDLTMSGTDPA